MKHTKLFDIFNSSFYKISETRKIKINNTANEILTRINLNVNQGEEGRVLLELFKPRESIEENISYF